LPGNRPPSSPAQQPLTPRGGSGSYSQVHTPQPSPISSANGLQGSHTGMCAFGDKRLSAWHICLTFPKKKKKENVSVFTERYCGRRYIRGNMLY
jgi:hypothetical protein